MLFFFFKSTATTEIYTLSLHDALPISSVPPSRRKRRLSRKLRSFAWNSALSSARSEEHTSELQSHHDLVCRLLLEKKNEFRRRRQRRMPRLRRLDRIQKTNPQPLIMRK